MSYYYHIGGGVTFIDPANESNRWHTYNDYGFVLRALDLTEPEPYTQFVEIPFRDGSLDMSAPYGEEYVSYNDRYLTITLTTLTFRQEFMARFGRLANNILGRRLKIILDKDQNYYYLGRCISFGQVNVEGDMASSDISFRLEPYKYSIYSAGDRWKWDPFNFYTDMALDMGSYTVSGSLTKVLRVGAKDVYPTITVSSDMTLEFNGKTYQLTKGSTTNYDIRLKAEVDNVLVFKGNGTVTIDYQGGRF